MSKSAVLRAVEAMNAGDLETYAAAFWPHAQRVLPGAPAPLSVGEALEQWRGLCAAFSGLRLDPALALEADGHVVVRWRMTGRHTGALGPLPATGRTVDVESCEIYEFEGDRVIRSWAYGDPAAMIAQLTGETAP